MGINRRVFFKQVAGIGSFLLIGKSLKANAAEHHSISKDESFGVLVDTTLCIGCRSCEKACNKVNSDLPQRPVGYFNCLLYTSPSPRDLSTSRMPSSA